MWRRKSIQEIVENDSKAVIRRKGLLGPIIGALAIAGLFSVAVALGYKGKNRVWADPLGWNQAASLAPLSVFVFLVSLAILVYVRRRGDLDSPRDASICPNCQSVQTQSTTGCVKCGSPLEPLKAWRWAQSK